MTGNVYARLYPHDPNAPLHHPKRVAEIVAKTFDDCDLDWESARQRLESRLAELIATDTPEPILQGHRNLLRNTVDIRIRSSEDASIEISFTAEIDTSLDVVIDCPAQT